MTTAAGSLVPPIEQRMRRADFIRGLITITLITIATHGLSLFDGKVLDDYWHQRGLREYGWSFPDLMRTLIIAPADFLQTWWQTKPVAWHYFRPFFILCMKTVFLPLGGGDPVSLHAFSLLLHLASALMVWRLCWLLTRNSAWSLVGALLFVIYPHSLVTVAWPSSQNVVLQTTLLLGAILAYRKASGLHIGPCAASTQRPEQVPRLSPGWLAGFMVLWLLAMFTRENAILMPAIFLSLDVAFGGWRHAWNRKWLYLVMGTIGIAFMAWREAMHIPGLPDVYCRRPAGDWAEYLPWLGAKFLHYICTSIWIAPMSIGPTGRYNPWSEVPGDCVLMLGIVAALTTIYVLAARSARGWWIWPLWIILSILPVAAVVATPHSGYMSAVGFAIAACLAPATAARSESLHRARLAGGTTLVLACGAAFMTPVNRLQWTGISAAEKFLPSWVMVSPPPRDTRDVFFINLPFVNIYCKPNLVDRLGPWFKDVNVHVLTWAPAPLVMDRPCAVEQVDDHSFTVSVEGQAYFSRLVGRFALEGFRGPERFETGQDIDASSFHVRILDADAEGVWKLMFTFNRLLTDARYCFYVASRECGAARLRFNPPGAALRPAPDVGPPLTDPIALETRMAEFRAGKLSASFSVFATALHGTGELSDRAADAVRSVAQPMATALAAPVALLFKQDPLSRTELAAVWNWWSTSIDERNLREIWDHRRDFDDLLYLRYEVDWDRFVAGNIIRTDLYLSGEPFDNPRGY